MIDNTPTMVFLTHLCGSTARGPARSMKYINNNARFFLVGTESVREIPEHEARCLADFGSTYCVVRVGSCPYPIGLPPSTSRARFAVVGTPVRPG